LGKVNPVRQLWIISGGDASLHSSQHGRWSTHQDLLLGGRRRRHVSLNHFLRNESSAVLPVRRRFVENVIDDESAI
jgi:hypothetical protein